VDQAQRAGGTPNGSSGGGYRVGQAGAQFCRYAIVDPVGCIVQPTLDADGID
jgi:hypothetical protein